MATMLPRRHPTVLLASSLALVVALVLAVFGTTVASDQGPAAAPGPAPGISEECFTAVLNMSDCLPYVTAGSTARKPDTPCCPEVAGLLESHPVCLCQLLAGGAESYGVSVDYKRALALPGICGLAAPPVSACALFGVTVPAGLVPTAAPSPSSGGREVPANSPTGSAKSSATRRVTAAGFISLAVTAAGFISLAVTAAGIIMF